MSGLYIEQKFAQSEGQVFDEAQANDALIFTNAANMIIGNSNSDNFIVRRKFVT